MSITAFRMSGCSLVSSCLDSGTAVCALCHGDFWRRAVSLSAQGGPSLTATLKQNHHKIYKCALWRTKPRQVT